MSAGPGLLLAWLLAGAVQPAPLSDPGAPRAEITPEAEAARSQDDATVAEAGADETDADETAQAEEAESPARFTPPAAARDAGEREWRRELTGILARREFRANPRASGLDPRLPEVSFLNWIGEHFRQAWERFVDWLRALRRRNRGDASRPLSDSVSQPATWMLAAGAAALLGLLLYRAWRSRRAPPASTADVTTVAANAALPDALSQPADAWARCADEFARTGEWRLALRALYLRLLALLHERGALRYESQRTNGDYVAALGGAPAAAPFRRVTTSFDLAWYGNKPFERDDYEAVLAAVRAVDLATARADAGSA